MTSSVIITWGSSVKRSKSLAKVLNFKDFHVKPKYKSNNMIFKLFNYLFASYFTVRYLIKNRPKKIIVVCPPVIAVYICYIYKLVSKIDVILFADLHNGVLRKKWSEWPLLARVLKRYDYLLSHNSLIKNDIDLKFDVVSVVLPDPLQDICENSTFHCTDRNVILVPFSYADDEPVLEVIKAASLLGDEYKFLFTGNFKKFKHSECPIPDNIELTGYMSDSEYEEAFLDCDLVGCFTTGQKIQMCALVEAISAKKLLIASDTEFNRSISIDSRFLVKNKPEDIAFSIKRVLEDRQHSRSFIEAARERMLHDFENSKGAIGL